MTPAKPPHRLPPPALALLRNQPAVRRYLHPPWRYRTCIGDERFPAGVPDPSNSLSMRYRRARQEVVGTRLEGRTLGPARTTAGKSVGSVGSLGSLLVGEGGDDVVVPGAVVRVEKVGGLQVWRV